MKQVEGLFLKDRAFQSLSLPTDNWLALSVQLNRNPMKCRKDLCCVIASGRNIEAYFQRVNPNL